MGRLNVTEGEPDCRGHAEKSSWTRKKSPPSTFRSFSAMEWAKGNTSSPSAPLICIILKIMEPMEMGIGCSAETFLEA